MGMKFLSYNHFQNGSRVKISYGAYDPVPFHEESFLKHCAILVWQIANINIRLCCVVSAKWLVTLLCRARETTSLCRNELQLVKKSLRARNSYGRLLNDWSKTVLFSGV
jgi:hypothetical protein